MSQTEEAFDDVRFAIADTILEMGACLQHAQQALEQQENPVALMEEWTSANTALRDAALCLSKVDEVCRARYRAAKQEAGFK